MTKTDVSLMEVGKRDGTTVEMGNSDPSSSEIEDVLSMKGESCLTLIGYVSAWLEIGNV